MDAMKKDENELEASIQLRLKKMLEDKDWLVIVTHGNNFQSGLPDLYCAHIRYGARWIETKRPIGYRFTRAQLKVFKQFADKHVGIWVLNDATEDEYQRLFGPPNWWHHLENHMHGK